MSNKHPTSESGSKGVPGPTQVVQIIDRDDSYSIKSDSNCSTDSSLGFGDFENGTIYDQVVKMDKPHADLDISEEDLWGSASGQGTKIDKLRVQNSTGVVLGNQTFIEGTVIFDRFVADDDFTERLQQRMSIADGKEKVVGRNGKRESNGRLNGSVQGRRGTEDHSYQPELRKPETSNKRPSSKCKKAIIVIVVIISLVIVLGVAAVLVFQYFEFELPFNRPSTEAPSTTVTFSSSTATTEVFTEPSSETPSTETSSTTSTSIPLPSYTFVTRSEWGTSRPPSDFESISHPVKSIVITETGTNSCLTNESCSKIVREEQKKYITMSWIDIGHSFLAAGYSAIYEGRGWNASGQHTRPNGANCFVIAFIGTFTSKKPSQEQIDAYLALIEDGVRQKLIDEEYEMVAHCQLEPVNRPGLELRELMKTWPHYYQNTTKQC